VETSVAKNSFKIILQNQTGEEIDIDYTLDHSLLAEKWIKKIKHLRKIPIDLIESNLIDVSNIQNIYSEFCEFSNLKPIDTITLDQKKLNQLHKIYEDNHDRLSRLKNNEILYKFHHSIHYQEDVSTETKQIVVGWGYKEGLLTEQFDCLPYYADIIEKNNIYLPWAELGKKPVRYYTDKEPSDQKRINQLCKPHKTLRAKFFISLENITPSSFTPEFQEWFSKYEKEWTEAYEIADYTPIHHYSAPILAHTDDKQDLHNFHFVRIEL